MQDMYAIAKGINQEELQTSIHKLISDGMIIFGMLSFDTTANCYSQPMRIDFNNWDSKNTTNTAHLAMLPSSIL